MPLWPTNGMNQLEAEEKGERGRRRVDGGGGRERGLVGRGWKRKIRGRTEGKMNMTLRESI